MSGKIQQQLETLGDGTNVLASKKSGDIVEIKVKKLSVLRMGNLGKAAGAGEMAEVAFYTGLDEKQLEQLTDESLLELQAEGRRLNFPHLSAFYKRNHALNLAILGSEEKLEQETGKILAAQA